VSESQLTKCRNDERKQHGQQVEEPAGQDQGVTRAVLELGCGVKILPVGRRLGNLQSLYNSIAAHADAVSVQDGETLEVEGPVDVHCSVFSVANDWNQNLRCFS
jgi:hypothetical protein